MQRIPVRSWVMHWECVGHETVCGQQKGLLV